MLPGLDLAPIEPKGGGRNSWWRSLSSQIKRLASASGSILVGFIAAGAGAVATTVQAELRRRVCLEQFGGIGDGLSSTADTLAMERAIAYCQLTGKALDVLDGYWVFDRQFTITTPFELNCCSAAQFRWTDDTDCGFLLDMPTVNVGLYIMRFPQMYSPIIDGTTLQIPGYGTTPGVYDYDLNSRVGSAVKLVNGSRLNIYIHQAVGWEAPIDLLSSSGMANINVDVNTTDFCLYGIRCKTDGGYISALSYVANTSWAKFPVYFDTVDEFINSSSLKVNGQVFCNEPGACVVYHNRGAGSLDTVNVDVNWANCGWQPDSTASVSTSLTIPYVGGNDTSHGVSDDGNSTTGYFFGNFCRLNVGNAMGVPSGPGGGVPAAGEVIRVKDVGTYNDITVGYSKQVNVVAIALPTSADETLFNGGVGGASFSKRFYCSISLTALGVGFGAAFYFFHQLLSANSVKPVKVVLSNTAFQNAGLSIVAYDSANTGENRQGTVEVINNGSGSITGTFFFFLEVE